MEHLWALHLKQCSYSTLEWELINFFECEDPRTIQNMIGAPPKKLTYKMETLRLNRARGNVAHFNYDFMRKTNLKLGLMERLGFITLKEENKQWIVIIHHERMAYYLEQTTLQVQDQDPGESPIRVSEREETKSEGSKDDLCVCPLSSGSPHNTVDGGGGMGEHDGLGPIKQAGLASPHNPEGESGQSGSPEHRDDREERRTYRERTHKSVKLK